MSKYLMNKLIHIVNMDEKAEEKYCANPRAFVEEWEKTQKLKLTPEEREALGNQRLWQALRPGRPSIHAMEFYRSGLDTRNGATRTGGGLQSQGCQGGISEFQDLRSSRAPHWGHS